VGPNRQKAMENSRTTVFQGGGTFLQRRKRCSFTRTLEHRNSGHTSYHSGAVDVNTQEAHLRSVAPPGQPPPPITQEPPPVQ